MERKLVGILSRALLALGCVCSFAVTAAEKTITVPEGQTIGLTEALTAAGLTLEKDDTLVKMGPGRLVGSADYKSLAVNLRIVEGVFEGGKKDQFFAGGLIAVRDGGTLDLVNAAGNGTDVLTSRTIYLQGTGCASAAVTVRNRPMVGALLIRGGVNYQVMNGCVFVLDGADATIATTTSGNIGYLSSGWICSKTGDHTLTLLGPGHTVDGTGAVSSQYQHRFRYGYGFDGRDEGDGRVARIVVDGASFTAHNVDYQCKKGQLPALIKNGGTFGQEGDGFGRCFSSVEFEWGSILASDQACTITLPELIGFPTIPSKVLATINNTWTAKGADIALDRGILAYRALTFGANAKLVVRDYDQLSVAKTYTLARSTASVSGCPTYTPSALDPQGWTVSAGADGKTIELTYPMVERPGVVDVRTWGVVPDAEHAEANVTAFANGLAMLDASVHTLFFPAGTTCFATPIELAGRSNLTLIGDNGHSRLQVGDTAASVLAVSGGTDITVTGLIFAGGTGVAVSAENAANLVVTNCTFDGITGTIADVEGTYPVQATDCSNVLVRENTVVGTTTYTSHLYATGSSTVAEGTEPSATEVVLFGPLDPADLFAAVTFSKALATRGLADYPQGAKLVKKGLGKLAGPSSQAAGAKLGPIDVQEGSFVSFNQGALGPDGNSVTVQDGATVLLQSSGDSIMAQNTKFNIGGNGSRETQADAVICNRGTSWRQSQVCTFTLRSDVTIRFLTPGSCGFFSSSTFEQNGHSVTVSGAGRDYAARFRLTGVFKENAGPWIVDNATLSASYKSDNGFRGENGVKPPLLKIKSNARLLVNNQDFADVFDVYEFEPGGIYEAESAQNITTTNVKGAPTIKNSVTLTIPGSYTARAADLLKDQKMTSVKALTFGTDCVVNVEDAETLPIVTAGYVLATSDAAITNLPKASAALKAAGWTTALSVDGKSLILKPVGGTMFLVR